MRLSLLLDREDFGSVLASTMRSYWSTQLDTLPDVTWNGDHAGHGQRWFGHAYLNFFAVATASSACFDVLRREYSYSIRPWQRPLQRAYVALALSSPLRRILSTHSFTVSPSIPDASSQLLIPGNHRIRLLHPTLGRVDVIHKAGFPYQSFERELAARTGPAARVAPKLLSQHAPHHWFTEEYFCGTPTNRMRPVDRLQRRQEATRILFSEVHAPTRFTAGLHEHASALADAVGRLAPELVPCAKLALNTISSFSDFALTLVLSHGDYQDANILCDARGTIRIIDWEFSTTRTDFYDVATLASGIRLSPDWAAHWARCRTQWLRDPSPIFQIADRSVAHLDACCYVWLLEELVCRIEQNFMLPAQTRHPDLSGWIAPLRSALLSSGCSP